MKKIPGFVAVSLCVVGHGSKHPCHNDYEHNKGHREDKAKVILRGGFTPHVVMSSTREAPVSGLGVLQDQPHDWNNTLDEDQTQGR